MSKGIIIPIEATDKASKTIRKVTEEIDGLNTAIEKVDKSAGQDPLANLNLNAALDTGLMVLEAVTQIAEQIYALGRAGAESQRLADSFANVAGGAEKAASMLDKLREASQGTISDSELMLTANKAMMLGVTADADQMARLLEIASIRGRALGLSTQKAFEDIAVGIGRGSPLILDNLGIVVDSKKNYEDYARILGKSVTQLTKAEKAQALLNAVMADGNRILAEAGGLQSDSLSSYEKLEAGWRNYSDALGRSIDGQFSPVIGWFGDLLTSMSEVQRRVEQPPLWARFIPPVGFLWEGIEAIKALNHETEIVTEAITGQGQATAWLAEQTKTSAVDMEAAAAATEELARAADAANKTFFGMIDDFVRMEGKTAEEVEKSTARIKLSMLERELSIGGLNDAEAQFLLDMGLRWGVYTDEAARAARDAMTEVNELVARFNNLPEHRRVTLEINETYSTTRVSGNMEARALGGPVSAGTPYLVGERGAEVFVPSQSGTIVPNNALGGANVTLVYSPAVSLASEQEVQDVLLPFIRSGMNSVMAGR